MAQAISRSDHWASESGRRASESDRWVPAASTVQTTSIPGLGPAAAVDVETDGSNRPRLVGVASDREAVYILPASSVVGQDLGARQWIGHGLKADERWLGMLGVRLRGVKDDTLLMAHLLDENRANDLKSLAAWLLDSVDYWSDIEPQLRNAKKRDQIPYSDLAQYCAHDVAATLELYPRLRKELDQYPRLDRLYRYLYLPLSDAMLAMEERGVFIDVPRLNRLVAEMEAELAARRQELDVLAGTTLNWGSTHQVGKHLFTTLGLPTRSYTPTGRPQVNEETLMRLRRAHPLIPRLLEYRALDKQRAMIGGRLKKDGTPLSGWRQYVGSDGRMHPEVNLTGTVTGRISVKNPNVQQVPTLSKIRALIAAPPGHVLIGADYKTLELGVGAWIFDEPSMLAAYCAGEDLHTKTATALLGRPPTDKDERKKYGKTPNFGLLYQQGNDGFQRYAAKQGVDMTLEEATEMRTAWHMLYPGVRAGWRRIGLDLQRRGYVESPSGRRRRLPDFFSGDHYLVNEAWREACNFPVQSTAAEFNHIAAIILTPILRAASAGIVLHVHDGLVIECPVESSEHVSMSVRHVMEHEVPRYFEEHFGTPIPIPLRVDIGVGPNWGELTEIS